MNNSDDGIGSGMLMGACIVGILIVMVVLGKLIGESSMESDCEHYGKHVDGPATYICTKQLESK